MAKKKTRSKKARRAAPGGPPTDVTINNPAEDYEITAVPYTCDGTSTAPAGDAVVSMWYEVDGGGAERIQPPYPAWSFDWDAETVPPNGAHQMIVYACNKSGIRPSDPRNFSTNIP